MSKVDLNKLKEKLSEVIELLEEVKEPEVKEPEVKELEVCPMRKFMSDPDLKKSLDMCNLCKNKDSTCPLRKFMSEKDFVNLVNKEQELKDDCGCGCDGCSYETKNVIFEDSSKNSGDLLGSLIFVVSLIFFLVILFVNIIRCIREF